MSAARHPIDRSQVDGALKAEIFVGPCRDGSWRWDVTVYAIVNIDNSQPGLLGVHGRRHLFGECGYARSERAAWRALRRCYRQITIDRVIV